MKKFKIVLIVLLGIIICGFGLRGKISGEKFDAEKWKTADLNSEENWSMRWDMMNSLRNNYQLIGMSKREIINLLGKPIKELSPKDTFSYSLGYAHSGIDTGILIIEFENDCVTNYLVRKG